LPLVLTNGQKADLKGALAPLIAPPKNNKNAAKAGFRLGFLSVS